ncbi:MAG: hypothetical protein KC910_34715 [Candidatus Eremiobacteraeota bacterium]|nr:hypothetical protein [Candidatus Eremiobacteraeota bacterium]
MRYLSSLLLLLCLAGCAGAPVSLVSKVEVPELLGAESTRFKVHLENVGPTAAENVVVLASLGDEVTELRVERLEPGQKETLEGDLPTQPGEGSLSFSARVMGSGFCYRSETLEVRRIEQRGGTGLAYIKPLDSSASGQQWSKQPQQQQQMVSPEDFGDRDESEMRLGSLEPVEPSADVENLIARVEQEHCEASRSILEKYRQNGNRRAGEFLLGSL